MRPKGAVGGSRAQAAATTPMSERQQMALLMQMTSQSQSVTESGSRSPSSSKPKDRNERGETPLHLAAIKGDVEQVSKLLAHRADPNAADFAGWTPLHEACNHGWYEVAFRLVQAGANVNARGLDNDTPLHDAAINGHQKLVKLLVERGADIQAKNSKGKTPLDVAATPSVAALILNPSLPISESSVSTRLQPRSRDEKKITTTDNTKQKITTIPTTDEIMDTSSSKSSPSEDVYDFKPIKESEPSKAMDTAPPGDPESAPTTSSPTEDSKRTYSEMSDSVDEAGNDEESRKKKRKEENVKEGKNANNPQRVAVPAKGQTNKQAATTQNKANPTASTKTTERKSPCSSPKPATTSDAEVEDGKSDLKVPPLKIVIPQSTPIEQEVGVNRNGKNCLQRPHAALPYVVASSNSESSDKDVAGGTTSPTNTESIIKGEDKKETPMAEKEEQVQAGTSEPEPPAPPAPPTPVSTAPSVELHPRKRKMKPSKEPPPTPPVHEGAETPAVSEIHPHEQPITNCYQLFLDIRKQIRKRQKGLFPVQPKPPSGFKDYLMNRCTYVLASTAPTAPAINAPASLQPQMKELFGEQEKERYKLRMQHVVEKEKLVLSVEQEILRVHGRAARALANQSLPFSVCTILRDEECYNLITPEQEEKDRNARSRYNGRLFLSWLQDVDDKWEKIKENMLLRHHNEAESLHAVQKMDWEWKLKELNLCDAKTTPTIDESYVPMVHVSDDFDL